MNNRVVKLWIVRGVRVVSVMEERMYDCLRRQATYILCQRVSLWPVFALTGDIE